MKASPPELLQSNNKLGTMLIDFWSKGNDAAECSKSDFGFWSSDSVMGGIVLSERFAVVISWMLGLLLSFPSEFCLRKYFCAWLATWVGVFDMTKFLDMFLQSPLPYFWRPKRNRLRKFSLITQSFLDIKTILEEQRWQSLNSRRLRLITSNNRLGVVVSF